MRREHPIHPAPPNRRCVITLGIAGPGVSRDFAPGLALIRAGLEEHGFLGDFLCWDETYPQGSPTHEEIPFAFKPFCFEHARREGYELVLWLDASIRIRAPIDRLLQIVTRQGYLVFPGGHSVGEYCKDDALGPLGITRDESFELPCCSAAVLGLDLRDPRSQEFLRQWRELATDGITFPGPKWSGVNGWPRTASADPRVRGHRHDQTAASVVLLRLGMDRWKSGSLCSRYLENDRGHARQVWRARRRGREEQPRDSEMSS